MKTNHTPECWSAPVNYGATKYEIHSTTNPARQIAVVNKLEHARLIAAAPDLLAALEKIERIDLGARGAENAIKNIARAVLAKARGA